MAIPHFVLKRKHERVSTKKNGVRLLSQAALTASPHFIGDYEQENKRLKEEIVQYRIMYAIPMDGEGCSKCPWKGGGWL